MNIEDVSTKINMLQAIVDKINPDAGSKNNLIFKKSDGSELALLSFDTAIVDGTTGISPFISFTINNTNLLEGIVDATGRAELFSVLDKAGNVEIINGTVGVATDLSVDIKFNRIDWVKKNSIELAGITIRLENVCLQK